MNTMNAPYGTKQYLKDYIESFYDTIHIVKLTNSEMVIGFFFDGTYDNKASIDFPLEIYVGSEGQFHIREWCPELEYKTIDIKNDQMIFSKEPSDKIKKTFIEYHMLYTFNEDDNESELDASAPTEQDTVH